MSITAHVIHSPTPKPVDPLYHYIPYIRSIPGEETIKSYRLGVYPYRYRVEADIDEVCKDLTFYWQRIQIRRQEPETLERARVLEEYEQRREKLLENLSVLRKIQHREAYSA